MKKFPGRGGGKKCAAAFSEHVGQNISPQQWSPWERGIRAPDEVRLQQMAEFFGVTVEDLRRPKTPPPPASPPPQPPPPSFAQQGLSGDPLLDAQLGMLDKMMGMGGGMWMNDPPGSPASFFWLSRSFVMGLQTQGLRIDKQCLDYLAEKIVQLQQRR